MSLIYLILGILSQVASQIVVSALNPIHRIGYQVLVFLIGAFLFMLLDFYFQGQVYIIVYVGAIAIQFQFIIMMVECNTITKISPFIPLKNKKRYSAVNFQNPKKKNVSLLNLSIGNKSTKKVINVQGLNTDTPTFGGAYASLKTLSGARARQNQPTGNPVQFPTIDLYDIALSTLQIKENFNQYPNLFENSITTILNNNKKWSPLILLSGKETEESSLGLLAEPFFNQQFITNTMSKLKMPILLFLVIMFIVLFNMDNIQKFLLFSTGGIESLLAQYRFNQILSIFSDNQIQLTIIIFVVNQIYFIYFIVINFIIELVNLKVQLCEFYANQDNYPGLIVLNFFTQLNELISLMNKLLQDFFISNELLKTYHIYSYFYPIWAIDFINMSDLETLGIMTYVAYPVAQIQIGLTLWAVMIGIISICSPRQ